MKELLVLMSVPLLALAQAKTEAVFTFEIANHAAYYDDGTGYAKTGALTGKTPLPSDYIGVFRPYIWLGDLVSVNGAPAKGTLFMPGMALGGGPAPAARRPIHDVDRNQVAHAQLEILDAGGVHLGVLCFEMLGAGPSSPGGPRGAGAGAFTVVGGTGAFLGVSRQGGTVSQVGFRSTSFQEDPALRRVNSSGKWTIRFLLMGLKRPEVAAAYHASDFTPVSAASPARPGETVILAMRFDRRGDGLEGLIRPEHRIRFERRPGGAMARNYGHLPSRRDVARELRRRQGQPRGEPRLHTGSSFELPVRQ